MELRTRILHAAAQVYSETGFRGATTRRIAQLAGVNEITLFRHFGSKTRLLHEAIHCAGEGTNLCELPERPKNPRTELKEWAHAHYREMWARRSLIRTAMGEIEEHPDLMPPDRCGPASAATQLVQYLEGLKIAGIVKDDVDASAATTMLMGILFCDAISRDIMPQMYRVDAETAIDQYLELFFRAIGVERS